MECIFLETIKICKLYDLTESKANDFYEMLLREEREKRVLGKKLTKEDCKKLYHVFLGGSIFDYERMKKIKLRGYSGLEKKDIRVDSESDEEEKIDVRDLFDFYYDCMLVESTIYTPTEEDIKDYCISKKFTECPRLLVHEKFKKIKSDEAPENKRP